MIDKKLKLFVLTEFVICFQFLMVGSVSLMGTIASTLLSLFSCLFLSKSSPTVSAEFSTDVKVVHPEDTIGVRVEFQWRNVSFENSHGPLSYAVFREPSCPMSAEADQKPLSCKRLQPKF